MFVILIDHHRPPLYAETRFDGILRRRITPGFPFQFFIWRYEYNLQENEGGIGGWTRYKGLVLSYYYITQTINQVLAGEVPFIGTSFYSGWEAVARSQGKIFC